MLFQGSQGAIILTNKTIGIGYKNYAISDLTSIDPIMPNHKLLALMQFLKPLKDYFKDLTMFSMKFISDNTKWKHIDKNEKENYIALYYNL